MQQPVDEEGEVMPKTNLNHQSMSIVSQTGWMRSVQKFCQPHCCWCTNEQPTVTITKGMPPLSGIQTQLKGWRIFIRPKLSGRICRTFQWQFVCSIRGHCQFVSVVSTVGGEPISGSWTTNPSPSPDGDSPCRGDWDDLIWLSLNQLGSKVLFKPRAPPEKWLGKAAYLSHHVVVVIVIVIVIGVDII